MTNPEDRFDALYRNYAPAVHAYFLRRTSPTEAHDATADVFVVAWRRLHEVPERDTLLWLYGVARKVLSNRTRSARRLDRLVARLRSVSPRTATVSADHELTVKGEQAEVVAALARLSAVDQETIRLVEWEGLTRQQVADHFGVGRSAIDQRMSRAYRRLHRLLDETGSACADASGAGAGAGVGASGARRVGRRAASPVTSRAHDRSRPSPAADLWGPST